MCQSRIKCFLAGAVLWPFLLCCGFADLRPIGLATVPKEPNSVLADSSCPVVIGFDTEMMRQETENAIQIVSPVGSVEGDFIWNGNELRFIPASPWISGYRYVLKISGNVCARDGREFFVAHDIPFYAPSRVPLPYLVSVNPVNGASTKTILPGENILIFRFSVPMDRRTTEASFNMDGISGNSFLWSDDDRTLQIVAMKQLESWTNYRWSISEKALSRNRAPLARPESGFFVTDRDKDFPRVIKVVPLYRKNELSDTWGSWFPVASDLTNGLGISDGIGVKFSKPMDTEKLKNFISFEPSLSGRVEIISPDSLVFIPDRSPDPESVFTLKISGDAKDSRGLKMGKAYTEVFSIENNFLRISGMGFYNDDFSVNNSAESRTVDFFDPVPGEIYLSAIDSADSGVLRLMLRFSLPFSAEAKKNISAVNLVPFFPDTLSGVHLRSVDWLGDNQVYMQWEGISAGKPSERHYYRLHIPSGRGGIVAGDGSFIQDETSFFIEAVK